MPFPVTSACAAVILKKLIKGLYDISFRASLSGSDVFAMRSRSVKMEGRIVRMATARNCRQQKMVYQSMIKSRLKTVRNSVHFKHS